MAKVAWLALAAFAAGCTDRRPPPVERSFASCIVPGIPRDAECGTIAVPEVPGGPETIALRVVRVRARTRPSDPAAVFLLAGGPGQAATVAFPKLWGVYAPLAETRDLVMVDSRGTGQSAPLDCPKSDDLAEALRPGALEALARRCVPALAGRHLDAYGTASHVADLEAVRESLGYPRIDLLGVSYGTRLGLAYASAHPSRVRSMVLDAVAPPELALGASFGRDGTAALDGVLADCAAEPSCAKAFPDARATFSRLLGSLEAPRVIEVRHPETDESRKLEVTRDGLASVVRSLLYAPELAALLPMTLADAERGRFQSLVAQAAMLGHSADEGMSLGLLFSVACAEDVPRFTAADRAAEASSIVGAALFDDFTAACARWPVKPNPLPPLSPIDAPTLMLSGAHDPVTPPRWAELLASKLTRATHVVVPQAGHSVSARGCVPSLVERFVAQAGADGLDVTCAARHRRPAFFLERGGPEP